MGLDGQQLLVDSLDNPLLGGSQAGMLRLFHAAKAFPCQADSAWLSVVQRSQAHHLAVRLVGRHVDPSLRALLDIANSYA